MSDAATATQGPARSAASWLAAAVALGALAGAGAAFGTGGLLVAGVIAALAAVYAVTAVYARPERGLWLLLLAVPLDTAGRLITSPVTVTVYQVALLMMLAIWGLRWLADPDDAKPRWSAVDIGIATLLAAAVWSLPGSLAPSATIISIVRLAFLWLFFLLFVTWMRGEPSLRRVVAVVVATSCAASMLALLQAAIPGLGIGYTHTQMSAEGLIARPAAFFDDPNYLATMLSVGILAAVGMAIASRRAAHVMAWLAASALMGAGLLVTLSRTGWLGVVAGLVPLVLTARPDRRRWLLAAGTAVVLAVMLVAPGAVLTRVGSIFDVTGDASVRTRVLMFESSTEIIADNWVFGTGLSGYEVAYPAYRLIGARYDILKPHQLPLAMWAEMGILGLIAELLIVGGVVWVLRHRRHRGWSPYEAIGVAGLVAMLVQSMFQYYLYFEYLWLFLAIVVVSSRLSARSEEVPA